MSKSQQLFADEIERICHLYAAGKLSYSEADSMLWMKHYPSDERAEMLDAAHRQYIEDNGQFGVGA